MSVHKNRIKEKSKSFAEYFHFIMLGDGHNFGSRSSLHNCGATRGLSDPQIWSHFLFIIGGILCAQNGLYDLLILINIVIPLSTCYHYTYEQPGIVAQCEAVCAKILFAYGFLQMFSPVVPVTVLLIEIALAIFTFFIFCYTNIYLQYYDPWHCLLHFSSGVWCILVAIFHGPLLNL